MSFIAYASIRAASGRCGATLAHTRTAPSAPVVTISWPAAAQVTADSARWLARTTARAFEYRVANDVLRVWDVRYSPDGSTLVVAAASLLASFTCHRGGRFGAHPAWLLASSLARHGKVLAYDADDTKLEHTTDGVRPACFSWEHCLPTSTAHWKIFHLSPPASFAPPTTLL